jgi:quinol monooxygenase YgiN
MIVVRVAFKINPAERANVLAYLQKDTEATRKVAGCLHYGFYQDAADENSFLLYEEWDTQADFDAFKQSDSFKESGKMLFPVMVGKPDSVSYASSRLQ